MKVVYVAGKFRAGNSWDMEQNIRRAEEAALEIWRMDAAVICPHTNTRFFQGAANDSVWLDGDIEIMNRCDAIFMVEGWEESQGARMEHSQAFKRGLLIFYDLSDLREWLSQNP